MHDDTPHGPGIVSARAVEGRGGPDIVRRVWVWIWSARADHGVGGRGGVPACRVPTHSLPRTVGQSPWQAHKKSTQEPKILLEGSVTRGGVGEKGPTDPRKCGGGDQTPSRRRVVLGFPGVLTTGTHDGPTKTHRPGSRVGLAVVSRYRVAGSDAKWAPCPTSPPGPGRRTHRPGERGWGWPVRRTDGSQARFLAPELQRRGGEGCPDSEEDIPTDAGWGKGKERHGT